jgi:hypothetical protein
VALSIYDSDLLRIGQVHKNVGTGCFQLEGLGMGADLEFLLTLICGRVNHGDCR